MVQTGFAHKEFMRIILQSIELPEATVKNFAEFLGWKERIMTENQSPNYEIDNPQTFLEFINNKFGTPIWEAISAWNLQQAQALAKAKIDAANQEVEAARVLADQRAKEVVTIEVV
jgi:hypothetical protein